MLVVIILLLVRLCLCQGNYCKTEGIIGFTGFKVHRQYKVSGLIPNSHQFVIFSHCDHGKLDYQKVTKVGSINKIDWETPICMLKPVIGDVLDSKESDTVKSLVTKRDSETRKNESRTIGRRNYGIFGRKGGGPRINKISKTRKYLKHKIQKFIENSIPLKSPIIYNSQKTKDHISDIENSTLSASMEWQARNLVCYKMARRKKYAKRDISFYIPETFVGGLFQCLVPPEMKKKTFKNFSPQTSLEDIDFKCDESLSSPILPLMADHSGKQWWDIKKNILNPGITQTIPFLTTTTPFNLRFSLTETPDMSKDTWAAKLNVNEDYDFEDIDLHYISQALALTSDFLFKLVEPIDFSGLFRANPEVNQFQINGKSILDNDLIIRTVKRFSIDQKLSILLALDPKTYLKKVFKLQQVWDSIVDV